jgi:hypothetical protein
VFRFPTAAANKRRDILIDKEQTICKIFG